VGWRTTSGGHRPDPRPAWAAAPTPGWHVA